MEYLIFAVLALLASASNTIFNRISSNKIGTLVSATIKSLFIVAASFILILITGSLDDLVELTGYDWLWLIILGCITSIDWIFYFLSIKRAHLEAFAPFEASAVLFFSNFLFMCFEFSAVTNGITPINTILFFLGLLFLAGAMVFAVMNKKINPSTKKMWILYASLSSLAMGFTVVIVKYHFVFIPPSVISFCQMSVVFVVCGVITLVSGAYKEFKQVKIMDYLKFFVAAVFNALLMFFRYLALGASLNNQVPIVNCVIALDFVLVSLGTVLFFKAKNKKPLTILLMLVIVGMILNVIAQLV